MNILIGCEYSGIVREAFRKKGHCAYSCDLLPADDESEWHIQNDVLSAINETLPWDLIILHPPCTALAVSGNAHYATGKPKHDERLRSLKWTLQLWEAAKRKAPMVALENPVGILSKYMGKPSIIQPYEFGHDASKKTCLWLHNLPPLKSGKYIEPRMVGGMPRWSNQTDSGQNVLGPSPDRWKIRSTTYQGIAGAMADQWGAYEKKPIR